MTDDLGGPGDRDGPDPDHASPARVRAVYDEIASHFSETRAYPWPEIEEFVSELDASAFEEPSVGLDLGCGNGRHAELLAAELDTVCCLDASRELLREATDRMARNDWSGHPIQGDAERLPLVGNSVDVCLYVATIHHLRSRAARVRSLDELARVVRPGGRGLVSAWSVTHGKFDVGDDAREGFDTLVDWTLPDGGTVPRFYHVYALPEFEADLDESDLDLVEVFESSGNCFAMVEV